MSKEWETYVQVNSSLTSNLSEERYPTGLSDEEELKRSGYPVEDLDFDLQALSGEPSGRYVEPTIGADN